MDSVPFVLLDDARPGSELLTLFTQPERVVTAHRPQDVEAALRALEEARCAGLHAAGYFSYELGYCLEARLEKCLPPERDVPLLWFGIFRKRAAIGGPDIAEWFDRRARGRAYAGPLRFAETRDSYGAKFRRVKDDIAAGDAYQINLTFPARFSFAGDPLALYRRLRTHAQAGHGAYVFDGSRHVLSLSPELFFSIDGATLTAQPMKGTAPRAIDPAEDLRLRDRLAASGKDRAENLMIVDLIRNDLSRIARAGSVCADALFRIETYPTVHQMVSVVRGTLRDGISVEALVRAMFPCGSVTGTPKIRAMEIIRELEEAPRGVYCGAVGTFSPGGDARFNVAIRTLTISGNRGSLGIGGGLVADSREEDEFAECLVKARYYEAERPPLALLETLRHEPERGFVRGGLHLARMERSAAALGLPFDRDGAVRLLESTAGKSVPSRVRLRLEEDGRLTAEVEPFAPPSAEARWTYTVSSVRVDSGDALLRHKTNWRELYEAEWTALNRRTGCDEVLFLNERGEITEGSRTNVFVRRGARLVTPPLSSGLLPGCLREALLESGECVEAVLYPADLDRSEVFLGNSLRGLVPAVPATRCDGSV